MTFDELIKSEKPVLVDFYATWCGPCKMMSPILEDLKNRVDENAVIIKIDVDKNPQAASAYEVQSVPTLMIFKNGNMLWRKSGVVSANDLEKLIQKFA